jgi:glutathione synthase/RimK-type ligase-like ATP-grasp enzyme
MKRETYTTRLIKSKLRNTRLGRMYRTRLRLKKGKLFPASQTIDDLFPEVPYVKITSELGKLPLIGIQKDVTEYMGYNVLTARFPRYKRFLDFNQIPYKLVNLNRSDWLQQCEDVDILIAHCVSEPSRLNEFQTKTDILERFHGKTCYPSSKDRWSYEDKIRTFYQVQELGFEHARTFISHDHDEAVAFAETASYPLISKIKTGSCSRGVDLIRNKDQALRIINRNFGLGRRALWTYSFEKDYVYFQEYIQDATYDLRIFIVGDVIAGYRRRSKGKDFRASGVGILDRALFPESAIEIALQLKEKWDATILAVDFVDTNDSQQHKIIEVSISFGLDYPEYLEKDGKRVFYQITDEGIILREGCFWVQDFIVIEVIRRWLLQQKGNTNESAVRFGWEFQQRH